MDSLNFSAGAAWVNIGDSGSLTVRSNVNTNALAFGTGNIFFTGTGSGGSLTFATGAFAMQGAGTVTYQVTGSSPNTITFNGGALGESGGTANIVNTSTNGTLAVNLDAHGSPYTVTLNNLTLNSGTSNDTVSLGSNSTLLLAGTSSISGVISGSGNLIFNSGGSLTLSGINTYTGSTTVSAGSLILSTGGSIAGSSGVAISSGATFDISSTTSGASIQSVTGSGNINLGSKTLTLTPSSADIFSGAITGSGGNLIVATTGSSTLTLTGANTYSGSTTVSSGTLALTGTGSIANSSLTVATSSTFDISGTTSGATVQGLSGAGTVTLGSQALTVNESPSSTTTTFSGNIGGSGGSLIKTGPGTLILTGSNNYTGGTTVSAGVLQGNTTSLQGNITDNGTVIFDQSTTGTYAGVISGTGSVTKINPGTLNLSNANTYTGATTVSVGTVALTGSGSIASSSLTVASGAIFDISAVSGATVQGLSGAGTVTLGSQALTVNESPSAASTTFSGSLNGTGGSLIKTGPGTLILTGSNGYTGETTVSAGVLQGNTTSL